MDAGRIDILERVDWLAGVDRPTLERLFQRGDLKRIRSGQSIVRQGEFGDSCFVILGGTADVEIRNLDGRSETVARLRPGQVFGELALIGRGERRASVLAQDTCEILELRKADFDTTLKKHKEVRRRLTSAYERSALDTFCRSCRTLQELPLEVRQQVAQQSTLQSYRKGDVIAAAGSPAKFLYLVRAGMVRVARPTRDAADEDEVLAYLGPDDFFGDEEVNAGTAYGLNAVALEPVEMVAVPRSVVWKIYGEHPQLFSSLRRYALSRREMQSNLLASQTALGFVRDVLEAGLAQARSALIIRNDLCVRCGNCVQACDDLHGYSRLARRGRTLKRRKNEQKGDYENLYFPTSCLQCATPECMVGCPTGAIARDVGGEVYVKDTCIGCGLCARNCDFGNIAMAEQKDDAPSLVEMVLSQTGTQEKTETKADLVAVKCDVCFDRKFAACVYNCPTEAILRVDPGTYFPELRSLASSRADKPAGARTQAPHATSRWGFWVLQTVVMVAALFGGLGLWFAIRPSSWSTIGMGSGVFGASLMLGLGAIGLRKRLRTIAVGKLATWARIHAVVGGAIWGVTLFHAGYKATSILTALLMVLTTLSVLSGWLGQLASVILPKWLAQSEDEALLPEDIGPRVEALERSEEELFESVDDKDAAQLRRFADRVVQGGFRYVQRGIRPGDLKKEFERRAKRLPPMTPELSTMGMRLAEWRAEANMHAARRGFEILLTAWLPFHLVTSGLAIVVLFAHIITVVAW